MSREVPEGWRTVDLGDVAKESRARNSELSISEERLVGVFKDQGMVPMRDRVRGTSVERCKVVRPGDFAYNPMRINIGSIARSMADANLMVSPDYVVFSPDTNKIDGLFLDYLRKSDAWAAFVGNAGDGGVRIRIYFEHLARFRFDLPPLHEQQRIAENLSGVDEAIAATRAVVEQTRKIKQGALERLLTKGIGHTRFQQTEIGEIPEGWEVATLEELLADIPNPMRSGPFGSALKSEELVEAGVPFLGIDNIQAEQFVSSYKRFLSEDKFQQLRRFAVNPNDVVITIMGTVGRCCVFPPDIGEAVSSKHIWAMSLRRERYIPELACWQMNFAPWIVSKFTTSAQGGIMSAINSGILRKLVFPVPGLAEQRHIFQVWQSFQSELQLEQAKLQNLETLKSALMSDLLTGRKRVSNALLLAAE
ncbi:type I restriction-modification system HsdS subunit protein [Rhizobium phaseoli]|uniref:restriction endonuclease subunit S n=1 Tax=Rhizobium phaseoli TaxID=396 RepID=UPI0007EA5660|nr:restriction endonuclease subunit S [Rhizobium phaseoli]ANM03193.1 type I restriction-modification system HsdS subunit protein [Rhizobium phaseoli]